MNVKNVVTTGQSRLLEMMMNQKIQTAQNVEEI